MVAYIPPKTAKYIPVVDLAASAPHHAIRDACLSTGFFYVANHGVAAKLIEDQMSWAKRFFALPTEVKTALHLRHSQARNGYDPMGMQVLDGDSPPDLKEGYYFGADLPDDNPYVQRKLTKYGGNLWPDLPGFREQMLAYHGAVVDLAGRLMGQIALSLDLPESYFAPMLVDPIASALLVHYPPHPANAKPNQLGAGAHTDWGGITILLQDDCGGLEVETIDGEWVRAVPIPDTFVVNLGQLMARWTNGLYKANMHRVLNTAAGRDRYSVPLFFSPNYDVVIECLPGCAGNEPSKWPPCTTGAHLSEMFALSHAVRNTAA